MLKFIVLTFLIIKIKSQTNWSSWITINSLNDIRLELRYGNLNNTDGLENFSFVTFLNLSNTLSKLKASWTLFLDAFTWTSLVPNFRTHFQVAFSWTLFLDTLKASKNLIKKIFFNHKNILKSINV